MGRDVRVLVERYAQVPPGSEYLNNVDRKFAMQDYFVCKGVTN